MSDPQNASQAAFLAKKKAKKSARRNREME